MTDYAKLKELAGKAYPGPWWVANGMDQVRDNQDDFVCETGEDDPVNSAFIAAANPAVVLELIAKLDEANKRIMDLLSVAGVFSAVTERDTLKAENAQLKKQEIELKAENEHLHREEKNDAIAYKAVIERQEELRIERDLFRAEIDEDKLHFSAMGRALEGVVAERDKVKAECEGLRESLTRAADEVESWGAYASDYFQQKHDLAGTVLKIRQAALGKGAQS